MKTTNWICVILSVLFTCAVVANGQTTSGTISGSVADAGGAVVPGATVSATEEAKKFGLTTTTDETGRFVFGQVAPGTYAITVEIPGFRRFERKNVVFNANDV
jgi:hypothetical protein